MSPDFQMLQVLTRRGVPFVIIGGHAVNFHGYRRATEDVDVVWLRSPRNEEFLFRALLEIEARYIGSEIDPATGIERTYPVTLDWIRASRLMMLFTKHGFLDLFDYIPGFPLDDATQLLAASVEAD
ncbi:MAG TPA: hypothetical protein VFC78_02305 [Tepidisphaeraceae bacterium]|nr:hypothetical protein [Tepidisphaeraceae bacterium]